VAESSHLADFNTKDFSLDWVAGFLAANGSYIGAPGYAGNLDEGFHLENFTTWLANFVWINIEDKKAYLQPPDSGPPGSIEIHELPFNYDGRVYNILEEGNGLVTAAIQETNREISISFPDYISPQDAKRLEEVVMDDVKWAKLSRTGICGDIPLISYSVKPLQK